MNEENQSWKIEIIAEYLSQYAIADNEDATIHKTSQDICDDLEEMGEFSPNDITSVMAGKYNIGFLEDNTPVWLLRKK